MSSFIGHLHPLLVHLPIGILLLACFFQLVSAREKYIHLQHAISITLFWGMISAVASCLTGYMLSRSGEYDEALVNRHQWLGICVAAFSLIYYLLYRNNALPTWKWVMPLALTLLIAVTGHLGGSLTHGSDYLSFAAGSEGEKDTIAARKPIPDVQQAAVYTDIIQPVLQSKCYSCHGLNRQKGKLRMDKTDLLLQGGKDGVVILPGRADESEMIKRIRLDKSEEHHMPPKEKPQLTEKEIALLHWWIASGASFTKKTKELEQPAAVKPLLASLQERPAIKKDIPDLPSAPVPPADDAAIQKLKAIGAVVIPVSAGSHYLYASFITAPQASDKDMPLLLPLQQQLVWLKLSHTAVSDAAMDIVARCTHLTRLQADSTRITDKGLSRLQTLTALQFLNLVDTKVTASGLLSLKGLKTLRAVYAYRSGVKAKDWPAIKNAFPMAMIDTGGYIVPLLASDTTVVKPPPPPK